MSESDHLTHKIVSITKADGEALDAVLSGQAADAHAELSASQAERVAKVQRILSLLDHHRPPEPPGDLVDRTMARISESHQSHRFTQQIAQLSGPTLNFGWYELGAVAASLLIMASLALPMLSRHQKTANQIACASGLQSAGSAMSAYAADSNGAMPRGGKISGRVVWFRVGDEQTPNGVYQSNSRHLYKLIRKRYIDPRVLNCPQNEFAPKHPNPNAHDWKDHKKLSYSYQNQSGKVLRLDRWTDRAILADKNPLFEIRRGQPLRRRPNVGDEDPSLNHGTGQNVLRGNGTVVWTKRPFVNDDNIWTIAGVKNYQGNEMAKDGDSHLVE